MARMGHGLIAAAGLMLAASAADAQTSLFNQPAATGIEVAPTEAAKPRAKPRRAKPRGPTPARALTISNASTNTLLALEVSGDGKSATLAAPLAPNAKTVLKLPTFKTCTVTVLAGFEGAGEADSSSYDICREKGVRFTD